MKHSKKILLIFTTYSAIIARVPHDEVHRYMMANYYQFSNKPKEAEKWYKQIDEKESHYLYTGFIPFLQSIGQHREIVRLIPQLDAPFSNNQEMQLIFANALDRVGNKNAAHERLIQLNSKYDTNQEIAFRVAELYAARKEPENAIKVIDTLLNRSQKKPNNFLFHFLKAQIYLQSNQSDNARQSLHTCLELYPRFDKGWLLYAMLEEQSGKINQAIKGYTTFLETTAESRPDIEQHLLQLAFKKTTLFQKMTTSTQEKQALAHALQLFDKKDYRRALTAVDSLLHGKSDTPENRLLKIELLITQKEYTHAIQHLSSWIESDKNPATWIKTLHLLHTQAPYQLLRTAFEKACLKKPKELDLHLYYADLLLRNDDHIAARIPLKAALNLTKDKALQTKILFQLGVSHYHEDEFTLLRDTLEKAVRLGTIYPPRDNLLAYYYATDGKKLDSAQKYITKALESDPDNPHFKDTLALISYKKRDYDQAHTILTELATLCPDDTCIMLHLAKVERKKGNVDKALGTIKIAQRNAHTQKDKKYITSLITKWSNA